MYIYRAHYFKFLSNARVSKALQLSHSSINGDLVPNLPSPPALSLSGDNVTVLTNIQATLTATQLELTNTKLTLTSTQRMLTDLQCEFTAYKSANRCVHLRDNVVNSRQLELVSSTSEAVTQNENEFNERKQLLENERINITNRISQVRYLLLILFNTFNHSN